MTVSIDRVSSSSPASDRAALSREWYRLSPQQSADVLKSHLKIGLTIAEAHRRQLQFGSNQLTPQHKTSALNRFVQQFNQPLLYVLLIAGIIALILQEWVDAGVIFAVVIINAVVGYIQEAKAEQAMAALAKSMVTEAKVIRVGEQRKIPAAELVPGDLVCLEAGDKIPADLRLVAAKNLQIDESALTGESVTVSKTTAPIEPI